MICGRQFGRHNANAANIRFGVVLSLVGACAVVLSFVLKEVAFAGGGFGYTWVNSWYDQAVVLPGNIVLYGTESPKYLLLTGAFLAFLGVVGTMGAKRESNARLQRKPVRKPRPIVAPMVQTNTVIQECPPQDCPIEALTAFEQEPAWMADRDAMPHVA
ncbi:MAG: hypothetical protein P4L46_13480 [Fimbriimonas sp.]|nr:hypothetical protein [Fimbriimonas sp.]